MMKRFSSSLLEDMIYTGLLALLTGLITAVISVILILLSTTPSYAEQGNTYLSSQKLTPGIPAMQLHLASGGQSIAAPLLDTRVVMRVNGLLSQTKVTQRFLNTSDSWAHGTYSFPLPEGAVVDSLTMHVGDRHIVSEVKEKIQAVKQYQAAMKQGQHATLLQQRRPNLFTTQVANIGPGEVVEVIIDYQQRVTYQEGIFSLRFPMVVAPRYIPGRKLSGDVCEPIQGPGWACDTDQVDDASSITPPVLDPREGKINPLSLTVYLRGATSIESIQSSTHSIQTRCQQLDLCQVTLTDGETPADKDFQLRWQLASKESPLPMLFTEQWQGEGYALLSLVPAITRQVDKVAVTRVVVFVIDTSGSMHGSSLQQAKAAIEVALQRLNPGDRFNLIQFNDQAERLFGTPMPATRGAVTTAIRYLRRLQAEGGTEIATAIRMALNQGREDAALQQVVFLTDGSVGNEQAIFDLIRSSLGNNRLFTIGIGSAPNSYFMRGAAQVGRGTFTYIGNIDEVQEQMDALLLKLERPQLTDIQLSWRDEAGHVVAVEAYPMPVMDLYQGEPLMITSRFPKDVRTLTLSGRISALHWEQTLPVDGGHPVSGIHKLWARDKIDALINVGVSNMASDTLRSKVIHLALKHQVVSRYTSLIAVEHRIVRKSDESVGDHTIPVNLPAGWSAEAVFGGLPQTATAAQLHWRFGVIYLAVLLLLVLLFRWYDRSSSNMPPLW